MRYGYNYNYYKIYWRLTRVPIRKIPIGRKSYFANVSDGYKLEI